MIIRSYFPKIAFIVILAIILYMPVQALAFLGELEKIKALEPAQSSDDSAIDRPHVQYTEQTSRDPFEGGVKKETTAVREVTGQEKIVLPALTVQGVIWGTQKPQVIINNKVLREGDFLDEVQILEIKSSGIVVLYKNMKSVLSTPANAGTDADTKGGLL